MKKGKLILAIGLTVLLASCKKETAQELTENVAKPKYVKTVDVLEKVYTPTVHAFGKLAAQEESKLSFKITGIIQNIYVHEGQHVRKGQVLARIEQHEIDAQVASAKASFEKSERDLARMEKLLEEKVVTLESYQNVKTQYDVAVSNLRIAEYNQRYSSIISPLDGKVLRKFADENELVNAGSPVFQLGTTGQQMVIKAGLSDKEVIRLQEGDSASIQFDALPDVAVNGQLLLINNAPDPMSGLYEVEVLLLDHHKGLRNGFFAKMQIYPSTADQFKVLPIVSLVEGKENRGYVYGVDGDKAKKLEIEIIAIEEDQLIVRNTLDGVDKIVTEGAQYLDPQDQLVIVNN